MTLPFGDFELVRYLAAGGMADLYLARSPRFGLVVVKRIQTRFAGLTRVVRMFINEGRIAQALDHPNVVKVLEVGEEKGHSFIAMEYIPGKDLLAIARRGQEVNDMLPRVLAVATLEQALRGLTYAHERHGADGRSLDVVHCDISPGNIVVSFGGTAKLVDFGIARARIELLSEDGAVVAGKYNYMAPEQIRGEAIDPRADLFSMGVMLYEFTVGKRLFRGPAEQVIYRVLEGAIAPPSEVAPGYPPELERIVLRALERDRDRRYRSARQMRNEVRAWLARQPEPSDKHAIAAYLRRAFGSPRIFEADEFAAGDDTQDLIFEPISAEAPLLVDVEDEPSTDPYGVRAPDGLAGGALNIDDEDPTPREPHSLWPRALPIVAERSRPLRRIAEPIPISGEVPRETLRGHDSLLEPPAPLGPAGRRGLGVVGLAALALVTLLIGFLFGALYWVHR